MLSRADLDAGIVDEATAALAKHASSTTSLGRVGAARAVASASKARYGTAGGGNASNTSGSRRGAHAGGGTPNGNALLQDTTSSAIAELEHVVNANARKFNSSKFESAEKHRELSALLTELKDLQSENAKLGVGGGDDGGADDASSSGRSSTAAPGISSTPEARRIAQLTRLTRSTEAELTAAEGKRAQYQHMLDRLRSNHVQFEGHMSAMQSALAATRAEFKEVEGNVRALENAKDASALDLAKYQQALGHLRTRRTKELENRKGELRLARKAQRLRAHREEVRAQLAAQISGDLSAEEEAALLRLRSDKTAQAALMERKREGVAQRAEAIYAMFDRVRQATGCRDISHLVHAFNGQEELSAALEQEAEDVQGRLGVVRQAVDKAKTHLDDLRATGGPTAVATTHEGGLDDTEGGGKSGGEESKAVGSTRQEPPSIQVTVQTVQDGSVDVSVLDVRTVSVRDSAVYAAVLQKLKQSILAAERQLNQSTAAADTTEQALLSVQQVALGVARRLAPLSEVLGLSAAEPWMDNAQAVPLLLQAVRAAAQKEPTATTSPMPVKPPAAHLPLPAVSETSLSSGASEADTTRRGGAAAPATQLGEVPALLKELGAHLTEEQVQLAASAPSIRKGRGLPTVMQVGAVHPALHCLLLLQCAQERCTRTLQLLQAGADASAPVFNESDLIQGALAAHSRQGLDDVLPPASPPPRRPQHTGGSGSAGNTNKGESGPSASLISVASSDYGAGASLVSPGDSLGVPASPPPPLRTQGGRLSNHTGPSRAHTRESSHDTAASSSDAPAPPTVLSPRTWGNLRQALAMRWAGDDSGSEEDEDAPSAQVRAALMGTAVPGVRHKGGSSPFGSSAAKQASKQSSLFRSAKESTADLQDEARSPDGGTGGTAVGKGGGQSVPRGPLRRMHSNAATIMTSLSPREEQTTAGGAHAAKKDDSGRSSASALGGRTPEQATAEGGSPPSPLPGAAAKAVTPDKTKRPASSKHGTPSTQGTPGSVPRGMGSLAAALLREPPSSLLPTPAISQRPPGGDSTDSLAPSFQGKSLDDTRATSENGTSSASGGLPMRDPLPDAPPTAPAGLTLGARTAHVHKKRSTSPIKGLGGVGAAGDAGAQQRGAGGGAAAFAKPWSKMRTTVGGTMRFAVDEDEEAEEFQAARHRIKASSSALVAQEAELYILQQGRAEAAALAKAHAHAAPATGGGTLPPSSRPASGKRSRGRSGSLVPLDSGRGSGGAAGAIAAALGEDEIAARRRRAAKAAKAAAQNTAMRRLMQPEHNSKGGLSALMQKPTMM